MNPKEQTNLRRKWRRWHNIIQDQIVWLTVSQFFHEQMTKNIKSTESGDFKNWLTDNYFLSAGVIIRQMLEKKQKRYNTISLHRLLEDIKEHYGAFPRRYFYKRMRYAESPLYEIYVNEELEEFAGSGDCVDPKKINKDLKELEKRLRPIATWTNKKVVHTELMRFSIKYPTVTDIGNAIHYLGQLASKYNRLLNAPNGNRVDNLLPTNLSSGKWKEELRMLVSRVGCAKYYMNYRNT